jgi:hypothetical protein
MNDVTKQRAGKAMPGGGKIRVFGKDREELCLVTLRQARDGTPHPGSAYAAEILFDDHSGRETSAS